MQVQRVLLGVMPREHIAIPPPYVVLDAVHATPDPSPISTQHKLIRQEEGSRHGAGSV
jgi:hypothetical protein